MTKEEQNQAEADCLRCYNQGYEKGKEATIEKAWKLVKELIERIYSGLGISIDEDILIKGYGFFKKAMKE